MKSIKAKVAAAVASTALIAVVIQRRRQRKTKRSIWMKNWISRRTAKGAFNNILREMRLEDTEGFRNYLRVDKESFEEILAKVGPRIKKEDNHLREAIPPQERLAVTLRFLATGESYQSLQYHHRISKQSLCKIIPEVCEAISDTLRECMKVPQSEGEWQSVADEFQRKWNFPLCIGALDGKHVALKMPSQSGSFYYNYKHHFSIVLLALVDANYKFLYVDIGCNGRISDGGVLKNSSLQQSLSQQSLGIPPNPPLVGCPNEMPYVIVADDAFPLKENLMKPYSQKGLTAEKRYFNYRLSRARRVVENAFGIMSNRFRVFMTNIAIRSENAVKVVHAACILHNFLMPQISTAQDEMDDNVVVGEQDQLMSLSQQGSNMHSDAAKVIRDQFCSYFNTHGKLPWEAKDEA